MRTTTERSTRPARVVALACAAGVALAVLAACADKGGITPPKGPYSTKISFQVTTTASQQVSPVARYLLIAALYPISKSDNNGGGDDWTPFAFKWARLTPGSQQVTLNADISTCLADKQRLGARDACNMYVAALILPDSGEIDCDSCDNDPLQHAFDYKFPVGPFEVTPGGRAPVIPPIDLSLTRFGVVRWDGDDALRLGGNLTPANSYGSLAGAAANATASPTLFALTQGVDFATFPTSGQQNFIPVAYPQLAIFQNGTWKRVTATAAPTTNFNNSSAFTDVTALSATEAYMGHRTGLYKFDGSAISKLTQVTDSVVGVASANTAGGKYVIAGSGLGVVWIGNATTQAWQRYTLPLPQRIDGVCITGPTEAFAASGQNGGLFRFDGTSWTSVPASNNNGKVSLQCPAPGQAFVIAAFNGGMFRWTGASWATIPTTGLGNGRSVNWGVVSASEIYAAGDSSSVDRAFYKFNGSTWQEIGRLRYTGVTGGGANATRLFAVASGGAAYYGTSFGRVEKITPSGASVISYQPAFRDVAMNSTSSAFVVGAQMFIGRFDGVKWSVDAPPAGTATSRTLHSVWSDRPANAWAVGTQSTIIRYDGTTWSVVSDGPRPVVAADSSYNSVWGSGSDVWVVGSNTIVHCKAPTVCANEQSGGTGALYSVWGTSSSNVFAVGANGRIARYNGTSWTAMSSPTSRALFKVTGSGPGDVWAVGDSVLLKFDGTTWTNQSLDNDLRFSLGYASQQLSQGLFQIGLFVRGPKEAYLGGLSGHVTRWDGFEWNGMDNSNTPRHRVVGISGASAGCALGVTEALGDAANPTLWRGVGSTGCFFSPMSAPTIWP